MDRERSRLRRRCPGSAWTATLALVLALMPPSGPAAGEATPAGFEVAVSSEKATYQSGEPITVTLRVSNGTGEEMRLEFSSGQRFDFAIRDARGREVWRWSEGQVFPQVLGTEALGRTRPQVIYRAQFLGTLAPGWYHIEATLLARNRSLSGAIAIEVR